MGATEFFCTVKSFKMLTPTVFETTFEARKALPEHPDFAFEAGQFVSVVIPGAGPKGRDLRRAYSIASEPQQRPIELCIKLVEGGPGTNYLYKLREGDVFRGYAPYGDFVYEHRAGRNACFIATGTGIAPFRSMLYSQTFKDNPPVKAWCLMGVRGEDELCYDAELAKHPGVEWVTAVTGVKSEESYPGFRGRVTDWLRAQGDAFPWKETNFYLCGNGAMITEVQALLAEKGVEKDSIHKEKYY